MDRRMGDSRAVLSSIEHKIASGGRVSREDASWLFREADSASLKRLAQQVRARFHRPDEATYLIMGIINYTNVCVAKCDYCSFYRMPGDSEAYLLTPDQVFRRIDSLVALGGTEAAFNGGFHPKLHVRDYAKLFAAIHERYPALDFKEMTVAEFVYACQVSRVDFAEGARILADAGTQWLTGGGAEVMDDGFRTRHSPGKGTVARYYEAQRAVLEAGIGSTATMVIGFDETLEERLTHLEGLRAFQDSVDGGLASFLCWTYKAYGTAFGGTEIGTEEYLRWLALCRIYLDNFVHIRTSVLTKNEEALKGLAWGANDFDLPTEDEVTQKAGATISHDFAGVLSAASAAGCRPVHRAGFPRRPRLGDTFSASGLSTEQVLEPLRAHDQKSARALQVLT